MIGKKTKKSSVFCLFFRLLFCYNKKGKHNGDCMIKIYGKNCINEALKNPVLSRVFVLDRLVKKEMARLKQIDSLKIPLEIANQQKMDRLFGPSHQGWGAYRQDYDLYDESLIECLARPYQRLLLLDGITDPHNLGAIIRSVDAFGYDAIILPKNRSCSVTETVAHVSTGAIEHVKIAYVNSLFAFVEQLKQKGYWICAADAKGDVMLADVKKDCPLAVIIGSEGFGISRTLLKAADYVVSIPMLGHVNSLNASVSAGIVLHALPKMLPE